MGEVKIAEALWYQQSAPQALELECLTQIHRHGVLQLTLLEEGDGTVGVKPPQSIAVLWTGAGKGRVGENLCQVIYVSLTCILTLS